MASGIESVAGGEWVDLQQQVALLVQRVQRIEAHLSLPEVAGSPAIANKAIGDIANSPVGEVGVVPMEASPPSDATVVFTSPDQSTLIAPISASVAEESPPSPTPASPVSQPSPPLHPDSLQVEPHWQPISARPLSSPLQSSPVSGASRAAIDWENLIGGKWALWVGAICVFLALASFLAYTWRFLPSPPPWARVVMGLGAGAALMAAGAFFRSRTQRWFSEGLFGAGLSMLYLSIWAGAQYFRILPLEIAFLAMALITALGVFLAVRYDAVSLSLLATLGGFLTPAVLQSQGGSSGQAVPFLLYVAVLDAGVLGVSLFKRWRGLVWLCFLATLVLVGAGYAEVSDVASWTLFCFFSLYFLGNWAGEGYCLLSLRNDNR